MSKEYGMDPYEDSYDWQKRKYNGWREPSKKSGAQVPQESNTLQNSIDVVPDITKIGFLRTARNLAEQPTRPNHIGFEEATATIFRGLKYSLSIQPSSKALEVEEEFNQRYHKVIDFTEVTETPRQRKFMTLDDVHQAARMLAAAG